jgi:hypothetical protein
MRYFSLGVFVLLSQLSFGQLNFSFGIGMGSSTHAESYIIDEGFVVRRYSGFRQMELEAKIGWTFKEYTSLYVLGRFSPSNSSISPYKETYTGIGLYQDLPFANWCTVILGAGSKSSSTKRHGTLGKGTLIDTGLGFNISNKVYLEFHRLGGKMNNEYYSMTDNESKLLVMASFKIASFFGKGKDEFDY